jgi:hypothetical protein
MLAFISVLPFPCPPPPAPFLPPSCSPKLCRNRSPPPHCAPVSRGHALVRSCSEARAGGFRTTCIATCCRGCWRQATSCPSTTRRTSNTCSSTLPPSMRCPCTASLLACHSAQATQALLLHPTAHTAETSEQGGNGPRRPAACCLARSLECLSPSAGRSRPWWADGGLGRRGVC